MFFYFQMWSKQIVVSRRAALVRISSAPLWDRIFSPLSISNNTDYYSSSRRRCGRSRGGYSRRRPSPSLTHARPPASHRQGLPNGLITISIIVMDHLLVRWKTFWCGFDIPCVHRPSRLPPDKLILKHLIAPGRGCILGVFLIHWRQAEISTLAKR